MNYLRESYPVAKKEHQCDWCGGKIYSGKKYKTVVFKYDSELVDWKSHLKCDILADYICHIREFDEMDHDMFIEACYEMLCGFCPESDDNEDLRDAIWDRLIDNPEESITELYDKLVERGWKGTK